MIAHRVFCFFNHAFLPGFRHLNTIWMNKYCLLALFIFTCQLVVGQPSADLAKAYKERSQEMLDSFINTNDRSGDGSPENKVNSQIRGVVTAVLRDYVRDYSSTRSAKDHRWRYADAAPGDEEYLVLQPEVRVCFADKSHIDSVHIRARLNARPLGEVVAYPHQNIFGFFMSANYTDFERLVGCATYPTHVEKMINGYKTIVADTFFVRAVEDLLAVDRHKRRKHLRKVSFLEKKLKIFNAQGQVRTMMDAYLFQYNLLIDRIIFDHTFRSACVQYSFRNMSVQALFHFIDNQWTLEKKSYPFMY